MKFDKFIEIILENNKSYVLVGKELKANRWDKFDDPQVCFELEIDGVYHECYFPLDYKDAKFNTLEVESKKWPFALWKKDKIAKKVNLIGDIIKPSNDKKEMMLKIAKSRHDKKHKEIMADLLDIAFQMLEDHNREQMTNGDNEVYDVFKDTFDEL
jgi:tRNA U34 2-thiouridine synthase MnmA/TrmU